MEPSGGSRQELLMKRPGNQASKIVSCASVADATGLMIFLHQRVTPEERAPLKRAFVAAAAQRPSLQATALSLFPGLVDEVSDAITVGFNSPTDCIRVSGLQALFPIVLKDILDKHASSSPPPTIERAEIIRIAASVCNLSDFEFIKHHFAARASGGRDFLSLSQTADLLPYAATNSNPGVFRSLVAQLMSQSLPTRASASLAVFPTLAAALVAAATEMASPAAAARNQRKAASLRRRSSRRFDSLSGPLSTGAQSMFVSTLESLHLIFAHPFITSVCELLSLPCPQSLACSRTLDSLNRLRRPFGLSPLTAQTSLSTVWSVSPPLSSTSPALRTHAQQQPRLRNAEASEAGAAAPLPTISAVAAAAAHRAAMVVSSSAGALVSQLPVPMADSDDGSEGGVNSVAHVEAVGDEDEGSRSDSSRAAAGPVAGATAETAPSRSSDTPVAASVLYGPHGFVLRSHLQAFLSRFLSAPSLFSPGSEAFLPQTFAAPFQMAPTYAALKSLIRCLPNPLRPNSAPFEDPAAADVRQSLWQLFARMRLPELLKGAGDSAAAAFSQGGEIHLHASQAKNLPLGDDSTAARSTKHIALASSLKALAGAALEAAATVTRSEARSGSRVRVTRKALLSAAKSADQSRFQAAKLALALVGSCASGVGAGGTGALGFDGDYDGEDNDEDDDEDEDEGDEDKDEDEDDYSAATVSSLTPALLWSLSPSCSSALDLFQLSERALRWGAVGVAAAAVKAYWSRAETRPNADSAPSREPTLAKTGERAPLVPLLRNRFPMTPVQMVVMLLSSAALYLAESPHSSDALPAAVAPSSVDVAAVPAAANDHLPLGLHILGSSSSPIVSLRARVRASHSSRCTVCRSSLPEDVYDALLNAACYGDEDEDEDTDEDKEIDPDTNGCSSRMSRVLASVSLECSQGCRSLLTPRAAALALLLGCELERAIEYEHGNAGDTMSQASLAVTSDAAAAATAAAATAAAATAAAATAAAAAGTAGTAGSAGAGYISTSSPSSSENRSSCIPTASATQNPLQRSAPELLAVCLSAHPLLLSATADALSVRSGAPFPSEASDTVVKLALLTGIGAAPRPPPAAAAAALGRLACAAWQLEDAEAAAAAAVAVSSVAHSRAQALVTPPPSLEDVGTVSVARAGDPITDLAAGRGILSVPAVWNTGINDKTVFSMFSAPAPALSSGDDSLNFACYSPGSDEDHPHGLPERALALSLALSRPPEGPPSALFAAALAAGEAVAAVFVAHGHALARSVDSVFRAHSLGGALLSPDAADVSTCNGPNGGLSGAWAAAKADAWDQIVCIRSSLPSRVHRGEGLSQSGYMLAEMILQPLCAREPPAPLPVLPGVGASQPSVAAAAAGGWLGDDDATASDVTSSVLTASSESQVPVEAAEAITREGTNDGGDQGDDENEGDDAGSAPSDIAVERRVRLQCILDRSSTRQSSSANDSVSTSYGVSSGSSSSTKNDEAAATNATQIADNESPSTATVAHTVPASTIAIAAVEGAVYVPPISLVLDPESLGTIAPRAALSALLAGRLSGSGRIRSGELRSLLFRARAHFAAEARVETEAKSSKVQAPVTFSFIA